MTKSVGRASRALRKLVKARRALCVYAGLGISLSLALVTTPKVPSDPITRCLRLSPELSLMVSAPSFNTFPCGVTNSSSRT